MGTARKLSKCSLTIFEVFRPTRTSQVSKNIFDTFDDFCLFFTWPLSARPFCGQRHTFVLGNVVFLPVCHFKSAGLTWNAKLVQRMDGWQMKEKLPTSCNSGVLQMPGLRDGGLKQIRGYLSKEAFFLPFSGFSRCRLSPAKKGDFGWFWLISRNGGQTPLKPLLVTPGRFPPSPQVNLCSCFFRKQV